MLRPDPLVWQLVAGRLRAFYALVQVTLPTTSGPRVGAWVRELLSDNIVRLTAAWGTTLDTGATATEATLDLAVTVGHVSLTPTLYGLQPALAAAGASLWYTVTSPNALGPNLRAIGQTGDTPEYEWLRSQYLTAPSDEYRILLLRGMAAATRYGDIGW